MQYHIFFFHYDAKIKDDSNDSLSTEKTLTLHVMTLIKSALNKDQNHYYYNNVETWIDKSINKNYSAKK